MKWFTFILVCGGLLMGMGMFNTSIGVADDTAQDSEQLTEQMEEGYNLDSLVADDEEKYTREDEWDERYQSDEPYQDDPPPLMRNKPRRT